MAIKVWYLDGFYLGFDNKWWNSPMYLRLNVLGMWSGLQEFQNVVCPKVEQIFTIPVTGTIIN